jgi:hypothetical protein
MQCVFSFINSQMKYLIAYLFSPTTASAHTGDQTIDEYPDISGITTARVSMSED